MNSTTAYPLILLTYADFGYMGFDFEIVLKSFEYALNENNKIEIA